MAHLPLALLGIPFTSMDSNALVDAILKSLEKYHKDLNPRFISLVDTSSFLELYSWDLYSHSQEMLYIFRHFDVLGTNSKPLIWLSYALGTPIHSNSSKEVLGKLGTYINNEKYSVFLLEDYENDQTLGPYIKNHFPLLKIAGRSLSPIYIEGENLTNAVERDSLLLEQINRANPDFLLINLRHPKQEVWFNRVYKKLHVPVSIGIAGSIEDVSKPINPFSKKTSQGFFSSLLRFFKLACLSLPLLIFHHVNSLLSWLFLGKKAASKNANTLLFLSASQAIAVVQLPPLFTHKVCEELSNSWEDLFAQDALILDFQKVCHLDPYAVFLIMKAIMRATKEKKPFYTLGISGNLRLLMRLHHIWDMVRNFDCQNAGEIVSRLNFESDASTLFDAIEQGRGQIVIHFFGGLDINQNYDSYLIKLAPLVYQKECILDLTYCHYIDNGAIIFLLKLRENRQTQFRSLTLRGLNHSLKEQFDLMKVTSLFNIE